MASVFTQLEKPEPASVTFSDHWLPENEFDKYMIPEIPRVPTGQANNALIESIDPNLYKPKAHMVAFRVERKE